MGATKRKRDQAEESKAAEKPAETQVEKPAQQQQEEETSFVDLGLDPRLLQAVAQQKFAKPTLVQRKAIPLALNGQDVLAKADCGSGKTAAYVLPLLSSILKRKTTDSTAFTAALILVPTRELADQVFKAIEQFASFCAKDISTVKLTDKVSNAVQRALLSNSPDIVISTPATAWHNVNSSALSLDKLTHLVLDEADLVLSYGYSEDLENLSRSVPKGVQVMMMSATLTDEVDTLKGIFRRDPTLLDLKEKEAEGEGITQFVAKCGEDEKFLLAYVIFKLRLIKGKCIIFVSDIDRCYRLKLFFEQFGIRSCILNSELPLNSRVHVVEEFNRNVYDIIIAADEKNDMLGDDEAAEGEGDEAKEKATEGDDDAEVEAKRPKKKAKKSKGDKEYGVSRGVDFKKVSAVINFDLPTTASSYTHRIGRTARAGQTGMALSFVVPKELYRKHVPTSTPTAEKDEKVMAKIIRQQAKRGKEVKPYNFNMDQVDPFRYRMNDALRAVTKVAIREARTRELRQELLKSEKLKRYFEENPTELTHLRHDGELRTARQQAHLKHVPEYLLPKDGKQALTKDIGFVAMRKDRKVKGKKGRGFKVGSRKRDPLKTFKARRKTK
ncbi:ATP-dependent DNA/RNA helicase [Fusarium falciforme]|uniref:RNA helicase n=1 Tax=Fusarium falciforme TaxID=195108 RepID=A0A9W8R0J8_9HYPO|nr:ATP-dependent DNA/RNA helicase [Fusarium falciforme]KAJ4181350.1 ATP-dependent DNA/RNA helicase [Fusarium falciforme]KAJ4208572.1 ATP-dependent DNA/RNA helicase [Fusarium falciforme]KAJ4257717.1 ATP-dependent DNA/RNA helicase [Fusarium falciforme]